MRLLSALLAAAAVAAATAQTFSVPCGPRAACQETQSCCPQFSGGVGCCPPGHACGQDGGCYADGASAPVLPSLVIPGDGDDAAASQNLTISSSSYNIGPHCLEIDVQGGKNSSFWKAKGWKYNAPLWKEQPCNRTHFTVVNRVWHKLDGFAGVTKYKLGTQ